MYPNNQSDEPFPGQTYVPYFYQVGLHYHYGSPRDWRRKASPDHGSVPYDFSSERGTPKYFDHPQTVEQIIERGYFAIPRGDPIAAIITDKVHTSWLGLDDVISQVQQRREIYEQNLLQIELSKCAAANAIYQHEAYVGPPSSKQMYARHKAIQDLYEQQRNERTTFWKDVSRLRSLLPESAQLYLSAHRKRTALQDAGDPA